MTEQRKILVIKLGALGDFIQSLGPMAAIRKHHPGDHIVLLTTRSFVTLGRDSQYFDEVWTDDRPKLRNFRRWIDLGRKLRAGGFSRVYDLQNNDRTALYFKLLGLHNKMCPEWVGVVRGASHRNNAPERILGHAFDGHVQTLGLAGIENIEIDDLSWVRGDAAHFGLPHPYVLLVPGCAPTRPEKRWPAECYGDLANCLLDMGYTPVILGTNHEESLAYTIVERCPDARNLCGQTSILDLVLLARNAAGAVGNDTGPLHMIAPTGCPVTVLFSRHSSPIKHKPLGPWVDTIAVEDLNTLGTDVVAGRVFKNGLRHKGSEITRQSQKFR